MFQFTKFSLQIISLLCRLFSKLSKFLGSRNIPLLSVVDLQRWAIFFSLLHCYCRKFCPGSHHIRELFLWSRKILLIFLSVCSTVKCKLIGVGIITRAITSRKRKIFVCYSHIILVIVIPFLLYCTWIGTVVVPKSPAKIKGHPPTCPECIEICLQSVVTNGRILSKVYVLPTYTPWFSGRYTCASFCQKIFTIFMKEKNYERARLLLKVILHFAITLLFCVIFFSLSLRWYPFKNFPSVTSLNFVLFRAIQ
jgi:hypothetical protein